MISINVMIFSLATGLIYCGFHNYKDKAFYLLVLMLCLAAANLFFQASPNYLRRTDFIKSGSLALTVIILFSIALEWALCYSTRIERKELFARVVASFAFLGAGYILLMTCIPERFTTNYYIQIFLQSHTLWHILVILNAYTLYWVLFDAAIHKEMFSSWQIEQALAP